MRILIHNFTLNKADRDDRGGSVLPVKIIANTLKEDRQKQEILPEAFDNETVEFFLDHGIIDWHHQSIMGETSEARAGAVIGKPNEFLWEAGKPVVFGDLTANHPIVKNSIRPNLEAGQNVFGASVGGKILETEKVLNKAGEPKENIKKIWWNHLAITAAPYVIAPGSAVTLAKAGNEDYLIYDSWNNFKNGEYTLQKAMEAGSETDIANIQGFNAVQFTPGSVQYSPKQVLTMSKLLTALKDGKCAGNEKGVRHYLINELGFGQDEAQKYLENDFRNFLIGVGIKC